MVDEGKDCELFLEGRFAMWGCKVGIPLERFDSYIFFVFETCSLVHGGCKSFPQDLDRFKTVMES